MVQSTESAPASQRRMGYTERYSKDEKSLMTEVLDVYSNNGPTPEERETNLPLLGNSSFYTSVSSALSQVTLISLSPSVEVLILKDSKDLLKGFCFEGCRRLTNYRDQMWKIKDSTISEPHCKYCLKKFGTAKRTLVDFWFTARFQRVVEKDTIEVLFSNYVGTKFLKCDKSIYISDDHARQEVYRRLQRLIQDKTPFELEYAVVKKNDHEHLRAV